MAEKINGKIFVKGYAMYMNTSKPVKETAKFHAGEYCFQISETEVIKTDGAVTANFIQDRLKNDILIDGHAYNGVLTIYSKNYPFKVNVRTERATYDSDDIGNIENNVPVVAEIGFYKNRYGVQPTVNCIAISEAPELKDRFEDVDADGFLTANNMENPF